MDLSDDESSGGDDSGPQSKRKCRETSVHQQPPTKAIRTEASDHNNGHRKDTQVEVEANTNDEIALLKLRLAEARAERKECALQRQLAEAQLRKRKK